MTGQTVKFARLRLDRFSGRIVRTIERPVYGMTVVRAGVTGKGKTTT